MPVVLHRFDTFGAGACNWADDNTFEIEVAPGCRLEARVVSRTKQGKTENRGNFIEAEGQIVRGAACSLDLRDARTVRATVHSGKVTLTAATIELVITLEGEWSDPMGKGAGVVQIRADGPWEGS
jgi:hypothetical protein